MTQVKKCHHFPLRWSLTTNYPNKNGHKPPITRQRTQNTLQHNDVFTCGLPGAQEKRSRVSIFGVHPGSWRTELKWPEGACISPVSCLLLTLSCWRFFARRHKWFQMSPFAVVIGEGKKSDLVWQQWDKCQERHPRRWREDTLRRGNWKKKNNNTKTRNYQNSIQARTWQLRAGLLRPLMMGPRLSICEEDPDGCNVSTEWVSGFLPCYSQITVHCWSGAGGAEMLVSIKVHHVRR